MKYWNINEILPYQRCFNFINGERSIGKTYTTLKFIINKCTQKDNEFIYIVRTQDEKKRGILEQSVKKVCLNEFKDKNFEFTTEDMTERKEVQDTDGKTFEFRKTVGYCIALSEAVKIKKRSFPKVKYMIFDEYMLEGKQSNQYVNGWKEPDLLLSIYHTVDREEDRVIIFLLGNNTSFWNPYHLHNAFRIPNIERGKIWTSENVLFQWAVSSQELMTQKSKSKFLRMIDDTQYGVYAKHGNYIDDNYNFVEEMTVNCKYIMTLHFDGFNYGVYYYSKGGIVYVHDKVDPVCQFQYALSLDDHSENTILTRNKNIALLKWLGDNFKNGNVRYTNMEIKTHVEKGIMMLV